MQDKDITTEDSLREAGQAAGLEKELLDNLIGQIGHASVKAELQRSTQEALDLGVSHPLWNEPLREGELLSYVLCLVRNEPPEGGRS